MIAVAGQGALTPCVEDDPAALHFASRPVRPAIQSLSRFMIDAIASREQDYDKAVVITNYSPSRLIDLGPDPDKICPRLMRDGEFWYQRYLCLSEHKRFQLY